jgi:hypothetical protein
MIIIRLTQEINGDVMLHYNLQHTEFVWTHTPDVFPIQNGLKQGDA